MANNFVPFNELNEAFVRQTEVSFVALRLAEFRKSDVAEKDTSVSEREAKAAIEAVREFDRLTGRK